ncbi:MAG TPA: cellulase family glycosylhydrolase [Anaeromyxobacter sp.]|nr:cellulase family glycosylhydrolase [Anaeromyxobacter sp.]
MPREIALKARTILLGIALAATLPRCTTAPPRRSGVARKAVPPGENPFLHAVGSKLVDGRGSPVLLRGICFGNDVWSNPPRPPVNHHTEADFRSLRALGMNAVRFYLNDALFEDEARPFVYKASGLEWLDQNFAWARSSGIYLVLNLHVPPGGYQSNGRGAALWKLPQDRERFLDLWRELARRYRDEPALAGYDLLNEPVVAGDPGEWEELARESLAAIREEDRRHAIFVERLNAVVTPGGSLDWTEDRNGRMNFFLLEDGNIVYEFHFYKPMAFTHQGASYVPGLRSVRTSYPGPFRDGDGRQRIADREYLEEQLAPYLAFGREHDVPLYMGEFGVIREGFDAGRNGEGWVADVIDLAQAAGVSFTYHAFHERLFGLYRDDATRPPADLNRALADVFARKLR